jgi:hypothetical protein
MTSGLMTLVSEILSGPTGRFKPFHFQDVIRIFIVI